MSIDWSRIDWYDRSRASRASAGPSISIGKNGRVTFNEETAALYNSPPDLLQVGILVGGRGKRTLILRSIAPDVTSGPTPLKVAKQGRRFAINASKFFNERELTNLLGTSHTKVDYDKTHDALVVSL